MIDASNPSNVRHWLKLCKTDPNHTKPFRKAGGFSGTDISPAYRIQRLTEEFGPCGQGWGYAIHERWRETFPVKRKNAKGDYESTDKDFVFVQLSLWWTDGEDRYETGPQIGGTECTEAPDEAYKMAVTDALGKCALLLGVAADVYLGFFDGSKYQRQHNRDEAPRPQQAPPRKPAPTGTETQPSKTELDKAESYSNRFRSAWRQESLDAIVADLKEESSEFLRAKLAEQFRTAKHRVELAAKPSTEWSDDDVMELVTCAERSPEIKDFEQWFNSVTDGMNDTFKTKLHRALERWYRAHAKPVGAK